MPLSPRFPVYVVSKGRMRTRLTSRALDRMRVPHYLIVESAQVPDYARDLHAHARLLTLPPSYALEYEPCDDLGLTKSLGPGPARNFAWDHARRLGVGWHWVLDDNIRHFYRFHANTIVRVGDGTILRCMEVFAQQYTNLAMVGPNYEKFTKRRKRLAPFVRNTRLYSCALIRTDLPFRWRARYNEDTDLSLRVLKAGYCTVEFHAFLAGKVATQTMRGGNTDDFYRQEGTAPKTAMLLKLHPDCVKLDTRDKFRRPHHVIDYHRFTQALRPCPDRPWPPSPIDWGFRLAPLPAPPRGDRPPLPGGQSLHVHAS